jgi:predicted DNA-binding protein
MRTESMRERQMNVRLSPEEAERLDALAERYGLSGPNVVRMLIKRESDAVGITPKAKRAKR